ncbi:unnamed protein product, partial [marine sediment metagenome]
GVVVTFGHFSPIQAEQSGTLLFLEYEGSRFGEDFAKEAVETASYFASEFEVAGLVLADGDGIGFVGKDVGSLEAGIAQECVSVDLFVLELLELFLVGGHAFEPTYGDDARENQVQLGMGGYVGLTEDGAALRVEPAGEPIEDDVADGLEVFQKHPEMILRQEHFASMHINWQDKVQSIRAIAAELNIGTDSIVFMDDSDFECELVRQELPEVLTVQLPSEPAKLRGTLENLD